MALALYFVFVAKRPLLIKLPRPYRYGVEWQRRNYAFMSKMKYNVRNEYHVSKDASTQRIKLNRLDPDKRVRLPRIIKPKTAAEKRAHKIRTARKLAKRRKDAAIKIETAVRRFLASLLFKFLRYQRSALTIQMLFRRKMFEDRVKKKYISAVKIQKR